MTHEEAVIIAQQCGLAAIKPILMSKAQRWDVCVAVRCGIENYLSEMSGEYAVVPKVPTNAMAEKGAREIPIVSERMIDRVPRSEVIGASINVYQAMLRAAVK